MSFLYLLAIDDGIAPDAVAEIILDTSPPREDDRSTARAKMSTTDAWLGSGFFVGLRPYEVEPTSTEPRFFGFTPTVRVSFIPGGGPIDVQQHEMNAVVTAIIHATTGDALYRADFSRHVWLLRRNGMITISDYDETFADEDLEGWALPYTRVHQLMPGERD